MKRRFLDSGEREREVRGVQRGRSAASEHYSWQLLLKFCRSPQEVRSVQGVSRVILREREREVRNIEVESSSSSEIGNEFLQEEGEKRTGEEDMILTLRRESEREREIPGVQRSGFAVSEHSSRHSS